MNVNTYIMPRRLELTDTEKEHQKYYEDMCKDHVLHINLDFCAKDHLPRKVECECDENRNECFTAYLSDVHEAYQSLTYVICCEKQLEAMLAFSPFILYIQSLNELQEFPFYKKLFSYFWRKVFLTIDGRHGAKEILCYNIKANTIFVICHNIDYLNFGFINYAFADCDVRITISSHFYDGVTNKIQKLFDIKNLSFGEILINSTGMHFGPSTNIHLSYSSNFISKVHIPMEIVKEKYYELLEI